MKKQFLSLTAGMALLALVSSRNSSKTADTMNDSSMMDTSVVYTTMAAENGVKVGGAVMVPFKNIVQNALGSSDHTTGSEN